MVQHLEIHELTKGGVVAVVRGIPTDLTVPVTEALLAGGITAIEITLDSPDALMSIRVLKKKFADRALIGAGTVLNAESASKAIAAGAEFIFSPHVDESTIKLTKQCGILSIPGAMTPSEIIAAYEYGADAVKVFPAAVLGPTYFQDVRGPLGHIPLIATGGIHLENAALFIRQGVVAVGVGGSLLNQQDLAGNRFEEIKEKAGQFVQRIEDARKQKELA